MRELLIVIDMQGDFIEGSLGSPEARAILPRVLELVRRYPPEDVFFTRDTHGDEYLSTQEGRKLPVLHCRAGSAGWALAPELEALRRTEPFDKGAFGSWELGLALRAMNAATPLRRITLAGLCTDICVIANALLIKAALPETELAVAAAACAGSSPEAHRVALEAMRRCQIEICEA